MEIKEILAHQSNYTKGRKQAIKYIVVHYTANNGDTATGNGNYFARANRGASAHYFVDENNIVQSVRDNDVAWHCGATRYKNTLCRNANSIAVEMCSEKDKNGKYYINEQTQNMAIEVVKMLMAKYNIAAENVLRHYDVTGKACPEPFVRNQVQWLDFKQKLTRNTTENEIKEEKEVIYRKVEDVPKYSQEAIQKLVDKKALVGDESGYFKMGEDALLVFTVLNRMGLFDLKG